MKQASDFPPAVRSSIAADFKQALRRFRSVSAPTADSATCDHFICHALALAISRRIIAERLNNVSHPKVISINTLGRWLWHEGHATYAELFDTDEGLAKLHATRIAWLESLVAEFSQSN